MAKVGSAKTKVSSVKTKATAAAAKKPASKPKAKAIAASASPVSSKAIEGPEAKPQALDGLGVPEVFPIDELATIATDKTAGVVFRLDGGFLDGLRAQVRRYLAKDGKTPGTSIELKISGPSRKAFGEALEKKGAKPDTLSFDKAAPKKVGKHLVLAREGTSQTVNSSFSTHAPGDHNEKPLRMQGKGWKLEFVPDKGPVSLAGYLRIELEGKPEAQKKALQQVITKAGLQPAFAPPNGNAIQRYAMMRLLWHLAPDQAKALASKGPLSDLKLAVVEKELKAAGASAERIAGLKYEEVAPGHFTVVDPSLLPALEKAGLRYAYSTVTSTAHVLSILRDGQKATLTRWAEGAMIEGMSSMSDVGSGGAQGVFSRLVTTNSKDKSWRGRTYKIILGPELLTRLDIWGWPGDYFGQSWDLTPDNLGVRLVQAVQKEEKDGGSTGTVNEIISPVGNGPRFIAHVVATSESDRDKLLAELKAAKFEPEDGRSLEELVVLSPKMDLALLGGPAKSSKATKKPTPPKTS